MSLKYFVEVNLRSVAVVESNDTSSVVGCWILLLGCSLRRERPLVGDHQACMLEDKNPQVYRFYLLSTAMNLYAVLSSLSQTHLDLHMIMQ